MQPTESGDIGASDAPDVGPGASEASRSAVSTASLTDASGRPVDAESTPTRERILHAARELIYAQGYNATGISAILKMARVNSGSLYHYFPTKADLLRAVLEHYTEMLWPVVIQPATA